MPSNQGVGADPRCLVMWGRPTIGPTMGSPADYNASRIVPACIIMAYIIVLAHIVMAYKVMARPCGYPSITVPRLNPGLMCTCITRDTRHDTCLARTSICPSVRLSVCACVRACVRASFRPPVHLFVLSGGVSLCSGALAAPF